MGVARYVAGRKAAHTIFLLILLVLATAIITFEYGQQLWRQRSHTFTDWPNATAPAAMSSSAVGVDSGLFYVVQSVRRHSALVRTEVRALVTDVSSSVTVTQRYEFPFNGDAEYECAYRFPLDDGSAVTFIQGEHQRPHH